MKNVIVLLILFTAFSVYSQVEEYPHVQDNGGGYVETPSYRSYASIGQAAIGICTDTDRINQAGYLTSVSPYLEIKEKPFSNTLPLKLEPGIAFPNPFNACCYIDVPVEAKIEIYNVKGKLVWKHLSCKPKESRQKKSESGGNRETQECVIWNPSTATTSGVYLVKAIIGSEIIVDKVCYLK